MEGVVMGVRKGKVLERSPYAGGFNVWARAILKEDIGRTVGAILDDSRQKVNGRRRISGPPDVASLCKGMGRLRTERLEGLYLDSQNGVLERRVISAGSLNTTSTHPREILRPAIECGALGFILVHNHPSGSLTPSADDVEFTRRIGKAAELMGIPLYDHVIISSAGYVSLKEKGLL
jgi:DNA repair protein RadC